MGDRLRHPPIGFAHRGGCADAPENTLEAFRRAAGLGVTGLESDAWVTADGHAVLDHDGVVRGGLRRRAIADLARAELPAHVPSVDELYAAVGTSFELSLDVKDPAAAPAVVAEARAAGGGAVGRLWLCHPDWRTVSSWRDLGAEIGLVHSTRLRAMKDGTERHIATVAQAGIQAINLHHTDWNAGLVALVHRFGLSAWAWDCQFERLVVKMLTAGCDAVFSDHVDVLTRAIAEYAR